MDKKITRMNKYMMVNAVDLFCGIGGLTRGILNVGINVLAGIDLDADCEYVYTANNNSKFINANVSSISSDEILEIYPKGEIRVLMGCAPCQPFSKYNKTREQHKDKFALNAFAAHIENIQPDIVVMENVPGLKKEAVFQHFINILQKNKYYVSHETVNAVDYGVPQYRKRLILLASKYGEIKMIFPTHKNIPVTIKTAIGHLPKINAGETDKNDPLHTASALSSLNLERIRHSKQGETWKDWPEELLPACYKKQSGSTYLSVYGRMCWDDVSPTITTQFLRYGTGRYGHPTQDRAISLREGAIIQSFPEDYKFTQSEKFSMTKIAKQIGNAVPVRLGEAIGISIIKHLNIYN